MTLDQIETFLIVKFGSLENASGEYMGIICKHPVNETKLHARFSKEEQEYLGNYHYYGKGHR